MFRPYVAIIRFSSESMVVVLHRIGMGMSRWWDLSICDVCYMLFLRGTGGDVWCALSWGVQLKYVCSLLSCVGLQLLFVHIRILLLVGFRYGLCGEEKNQRIIRNTQVQCVGEMQSFGAPLQIWEMLLLASSCLSVRPHGTTRLPQGGLSWNLMSDYLWIICLVWLFMDNLFRNLKL